MLGKTRLILAGLFFFTCHMAVAQNEQFTEGENNLTAFETLETNISVDYFEHRFEDVLKDLGDQTGLTFVLDESAGDNNLDDEALITFSQENMRAATLLAFMLRPFQCTWSIHDGVVVILSEDAALDQLNLKVFNCSDLLAKIQPRTEMRGPGIVARNTGGGGFGGGGGRSAGGVFAIQEAGDNRPDDPFADDNDESEMSDPFADDDEPEADPFAVDDAPEADPFADDPVQETPAHNQDSTQQKSDEEPEPPVPPNVFEVTISPHQQLVELIQDAVAPHSWEENGGVAKIVTINDLVVVRQTQTNLREIATLLDLLERSGL